jgi:stage III sporulation protein AD
MELIVKIAVLGIIGSITALLIKRSNPEMALALALATGAVILVFAMELFSGVKELLDLASEASGLSSAVVAPVLKCMGIGIITKLASELCRDAGQGSIASTVELAGAACALYVALPLIKTLLKMIGEMA